LVDEPAFLSEAKTQEKTSTGPKTTAGKAISARNNFRHGFNGAFTVLPWEDQTDFDAMLRALLEEHKPCGLTETTLVDRMAQALWLSRRAVVLQHVTFNHELPTCDDPKQLALYIRYQTTNERTFHKCLQQLLSLRAEKRKQEIGFESQTRKNEDHAIKKAAEKRRQEAHELRVLLAQEQLKKRSQSAIMSQVETREPIPPGSAPETPLSASI
jgi:hypothetical protein